MLYLSQFTYEVLVNMMDRLSLKSLDQLLFDQKKKRLLISKNLSTAGYVGKSSIYTRYTAA
jgi:hypothetical protein